MFNISGYVIPWCWIDNRKNNITTNVLQKQYNFLLWKVAYNYYMNYNIAVINIQDVPLIELYQTI